MIDKNGKLFGKISIIDLGIIVLVLAFAAGVYVKFGVLDQTTTATTNGTITFTVKISSVRVLYYEQLDIGDALYESDNDTKIGVITDISKEAAEISYVDKDGETKKAPAADRYDIYLTIEGDGSITGGRYLMNRTYEIGLGSSKPLSTKFVKFTGQIKEIMSDGQ